MNLRRELTCLVALVGLFILTGTQPLLSETHANFKAIARFNHALFRFQEQPHCTAFQTRQGLIITSLTCLPKPKNALSHILFAYDRGDFYRHVLARTALFRVSHSHNIAVLCGNTQPDVGFSVSSDMVGVFADVVVKGYGVPQKQIVRDYHCKLFTDENGTAQLGECSLPPGLSGAPVILSGTDTVVGTITSVEETNSRFVALTNQAINKLCHADIATDTRPD